MATCAHCKIEETELYDNGVPICLKCSEARTVNPKPSFSEQEIRAMLLQNLIEATARNCEAMREFDEVMGHFPGGLPHPAGGQRINNASNALTIARQQMAIAHIRINDYISRGIVPEDLKRSG